MAYTFDQIIELANLSGIPNNPTSTYRENARTLSGKRSHHADGRAVDFWGESQDDLAEFYMQFPTLEVFHKSKTTGKWYGTSKGKPVNESTHPELVQQHINHLHVAMNEGQVGPGSFLDKLRQGLVTATSGIGALGKYLPTPGNVTDALGNVGSGIYSIAQSAASVGQLAGTVSRALLPTNLMRGFALLMGVIFILIGIWFLAREVKES